MFYGFELNEFPAVKNFIKWCAIQYGGLLTLTIFLYLSLRESAPFSCDGEDYALNTGNVFFVPAGHYYERRPINGELCTMYYIHFSLCSETLQYDSDALLSELINIRRK